MRTSVLERPVDGDQPRDTRDEEAVLAELAELVITIKWYPIGLSWEQADDIRQEVFCDLVQRVRRGRGLPHMDNPRGFLVEAFKRKAATVWRRDQCRRLLLEDYRVYCLRVGAFVIGPEAVTPLDELARMDEEELLQGLRAHLEAAGKEGRELLLVLNGMLDGQPREAILAALDKSLATLKRRRVTLYDRCKAYTEACAGTPPAARWRN